MTMEFKTDLVERLRLNASPFGEWGELADQLQLEAADEIEKLRAECLRLNHAEAESMAVVLSLEEQVGKLRAALADSGWSELLSTHVMDGRRDAERGVFDPPRWTRTTDPSEMHENAAYKKGWNQRRKELGDAFKWDGER